jgi:hypothetical protein
MNAYERLRSLMADADFVTRVNTCFFGIRHYGTLPHSALAHMADSLCSKYGLSAEVHPHAVVIYDRSSRSKHPACLVLSMQLNQTPSPSAMAYRFAGYSLLQAFEVDADDTDVAGDCPQPTNWVKTKGRVLLH